MKPFDDEFLKKLTEALEEEDELHEPQSFVSCLIREWIDWDGNGNISQDTNAV